MRVLRHDGICVLRFGNWWYGLASVWVGVANQSKVVTSQRGPKPRLSVYQTSRLLTSTRWKTGPFVNSTLRTCSLPVGAKFVGPLRQLVAQCGDEVVGVLAGVVRVQDSCT